MKPITQQTTSNLAAVCGIRNRKQRETNKTHYTVAPDGNVHSFVVSTILRYSVYTRHVHVVYRENTEFFFVFVNNARQINGEDTAYERVLYGVVEDDMRTSVVTTPSICFSRENNDRRAQGVRPLTVTAASVRG